MREQRVIMVDDHMYMGSAKEGDIGVLIDGGIGIGNALVDWGQGPEKCHWSRFDLA